MKLWFDAGDELTLEEVRVREHRRGDISLGGGGKIDLEEAGAAPILAPRDLC